jgi:phosphoribosylaminoimidazole-succinocarboxamide synthase
MTNNNYGKYWYFRNQADEDNDTDMASSAMLPVENIVSMIPTGTTTLTIYFEKATHGTPAYETQTTGQHGHIHLTMKAGKVKDTIKDLVALMNAGPRQSDGVTVIADNSTTDYDNTTRQAVYFSHITACSTIRTR